jgi:hypothetical protein
MTQRGDKLSGSSGDGLASPVRDIGSSVIASAERRLVRCHVFRPDSRPLVKLQSLLAAVAIVTGVLFVLTGAVSMWHHGGGSGSIAVDVIWFAVRIMYSLARLILIGVLLATLYQWFLSRRRSSVRS